MKVAIIGTGYVGLPTGVGLADIGHTVTCIDNNPNKVAELRNGKITLYEEGLEDLFLKNSQQTKRLSFTCSMKEGVQGADIVLIAVGTPPNPTTGEADLQYIFEAVNELAPFLKEGVVVAIKSTVPVKTGEDVQKLIREINPSAKTEVVSLPEFLREGFAVHDFFNPDRIIAGTDSDAAKEIIRELYAPMKNAPKILFVKRESSEMIKYASNAFLAIKIHYINEVSNYCEACGADVTEVSEGMGLDDRIGNRFLNAGPGYGGSCFPKDTKAFAWMASKKKVDVSLVKAVIIGNEARKKQMAMRILSTVQGFKNPRIAVWGLAFKEGTDDCRESPAMEIVQELLGHSGVQIAAYDPKALKTASQILGSKITYAENMYAAVTKADVLAILTEWQEFKHADWASIAQLMNHQNIVDCRNLVDTQELKDLGFRYQGIGR